MGGIEFSRYLQHTHTFNGEWHVCQAREEFDSHFKFPALWRAWELALGMPSLKVKRVDPSWKN